MSDKDGQGEGKGQIETFFDPAVFSGMRLALPDGEHRVEAWPHSFNGREFSTRTHYGYGPLPS